MNFDSQNSVSLVMILRVFFITFAHRLSRSVTQHVYTLHEQ